MYGLFSTTAMGSILYAYFGKIAPFSSNPKNSELLLWSSTSSASSALKKIPIVNRGLAFATLSLGIGFVSQTFPKLQIPVEYAAADADANSGAGGVSSQSNQSNQSSQSNQSNQSSQNGIVEPQPKQWKVRCPFDFTDSKTKQLSNNNSNSNKNEPLSINDIHGMDRITRHPGLWSFGLIGLGSSFLSPCIPTKVYLSMPLLMALIGGHHQDSRFRRNIGGSFISEEYDYLTSNVPFWAMISGKQGDDRLTLLSELCNKEIKGLNLALSMGMAALFVARRGR